ncbi:MAG: ribokinase [Novosphingobium sp.]|nr:ribokinase [Novosphingobium sp.]
MAVQVAGSINVDLIQTVEALPRPGETVLAHRSVRLPGGKGANQAVAAARAGAATHMIGATGSDEAGQWMRERLAAEGIGTQGIATLAGEPTGTACIAVDRTGENQIIVSPGANAGLMPARVRPFGHDTRVLLAQLEVPAATVHAFLAAPAAQGTVRILNAAPALPEASSLFGLTDVLIVNQHELALYLGLPDAPANVEAALAARRLIACPDQVVIVTLGAQGAVAVRAGSHCHAPALPVVPVDTIGAGDCFAGALAARIDAGESVEEALPFANAAAAFCTQGQGAIPAIPHRPAVEEALKNAPDRGKPR